ncbi:MAG: ATP-binding protein [Candidatus Paceibacterota bacterium]|jgi:signal transduction histidine kinase
MNNLICPWDPPIYLIFSSSVPTLLYYAYIPIILLSIFFGIYILIKSNFSLQGKLFTAISLSFSFWVINILIQWTSNDIYTQMFSWQLTAFFEILIFIFSVYFHQVFIINKDIDWKKKGLFASILLVVVILLPSQFNINYFYLSDIDCGGQNGILWNFIYIIEPLLILMVAYIGFRWGYKERQKTGKISWAFLFTIAVIIALSLFYITNLAGELTKIYEINLLGPIGFIVFIGILSYLIIKFQLFNIKLIATQALVWGLAILIGAQFFFIQSTTNFILNGVTFVGIIIFGQYLIKSVKREVKQRERLENLRLKLEESNLNLEIANDKLKGLDQLKTEFVSLASHQLRSPLTAIKGYTSMLLEGDYGEMDPRVKDTVGRIMESSNNLTLVVEDLLNVSKIESGGMKYEMIKFDFGDMINDVVKELSITAEKKGLKLISNISNEVKYIVNGDKDKLRQVLINLIDNSMKYTKEGEINVGIKNENGKIILSIKDTGVGIEKGKEEALFEKFSRGEGSKENAGGSGIGLYLVREVMKAHNGRVWVESEGLGKGSTFFVEINCVE